MGWGWFMVGIKWTSIVGNQWSNYNMASGCCNLIVELQHGLQMLQFNRRITTWPLDVAIQLLNYNMASGCCNSIVELQHGLWMLQFNRWITTWPLDVAIQLSNYNMASRCCNSIVKLQHGLRMLQFNRWITTQPPDVVIRLSNYNMASQCCNSIGKLQHGQYTAPNRGRQQCNSDQAKLATTQLELETHMCCPGRESQENKEKTSACPFMKQIRLHLTPFTFSYK